MTELVLIRHGETDMNRELRFQGQVDVSLNAVGHAQARRLADRLAGEPADAVVVSDLLRACQTAAPISGGLAIPYVTDAGLREQAFGRVDGMRVEDIQREHPQAWAGWLRFDEDFAMPDGESTRAFHARVMAFLQRLVAAHPQQTVVVVTHGGVLDMIYRTARSLGLSGPRQSEIPNAGLNRIRVRDGAMEIITWADTRHLADLPPQPVYDQRKFVSEDGKSRAV
ncbi:histidine phosphatase family protein [Ramlibacter ginsenosidimutans]|uniref:Histidine phosphatase family protein n=1 Tax=Ramlibacter ginsenosidimutans TaxID=502333 RepID=A0A934TPL0_9BURK|nr:histidine phosphatase family protein [Ramlibacter ginsenosidimutans]MBK6005079.1 histidine phosphatase family protein [Ramlibacter ginsenosidimutans]